MISWPIDQRCTIYNTESIEQMFITWVSVTGLQPYVPSGYWSEQMLMQRTTMNRVRMQLLPTYPYWSKYPPRPSVPKSSLNTICGIDVLFASIYIWHNNHRKISSFLTLTLHNISEKKTDKKSDQLGNFNLWFVKKKCSKHLEKSLTCTLAILSRFQRGKNRRFAKRSTSWKYGNVRYSCM